MDLSKTILFVFQVEEVKKMKIGDPLDRSTDHGPQNHKAHLDKLLEYCQMGVKEGATLIYGGKQVQRAGEQQDLEGHHLDCIVVLGVKLWFVFPPASRFLL